MTLPLTVASEIKHVLGLKLFKPFGEKNIIYETHDARRLKAIIDNWNIVKPQLRESLFSNEKTHPLEILEEFQMLYPDGRGVIKYDYFNKNKGIGRLMSTTETCLQNMYREARNFITEEVYDDVDMVNAQPSLLRWVCQKLNIQHKQLTEYIDNREKHLAEIGDLNNMSREDCKMLIIFMMNRGFHTYQRLEHKTDWLTAFYFEIQQIQEQLHYRFPKTKDEIQKLKMTTEGAGSNMLGSLLSTIMMTVENYILMTIIHIFKEEGIITNNCVLMFDGVLIPKNPRNEKTIEKVKKWLKEHYNMNLGIKVKPVELSLDLKNISQGVQRVKNNNVPEVLQPKPNFYENKQPYLVQQPFKPNDLPSVLDPRKVRKRKQKYIPANVSAKRMNQQLNNMF